MDLQEYLRAIRRRWWVLAVFTLLGAAIGALSADRSAGSTPSSYRAVHSLLYSGDPYDTSGGKVGTVLFDQVPVFVQVGEVPKRVQQVLGSSASPQQLAAQVKVTSDAKTGLVEIAATSSDPTQAEQIANTFATQTISYLSERQDQMRRDRLASALARVQRFEDQVRADDVALVADPLNQTLKAQRDANARQYSTAYEEYQNTLSESASVSVTTLAVAVAEPVKPGVVGVPDTPLKRGILAGIVGAMIGFAIVMLAERLDNRVRDRARAEEVFNLPVMVEIPSFSRGEDGAQLVVGTDRSLRLAEVYRTLRTSLIFLAAGPNSPDPDNPHVGVIVVTSPGPGEGKTSTSANLAAAFAETNRRVLVVNADFRRPRIARFFVRARGGAEVLDVRGLSMTGFHRWVRPTMVANVDLLDLEYQTGTPGELARESARAIASLRNSYDVVIVDTPPLSITAEGLEFVPDATAVLVMARLGRTSVNAATRAAELLRYGGAHNVALGLSDTGGQLSGKGYYGYYGYHRQKANQPRRGRRSRPASSAPSLPARGTASTGAAAPRTRAEWAQAVAEGQPLPWQTNGVGASPSNDHATVNGHAPVNGSAPTNGSAPINDPWVVPPSAPAPGAAPFVSGSPPTDPIQRVPRA